MGVSDKTLPLPTSCLECGEDFVPTMDRRKGKVQRFCCAKHRLRYKQRQWRRTHPGYHLSFRPPQRQTRTCLMCPNTFHPKSDQKCCSRECNRQYRAQYRARYTADNPDVLRRAEINRAIKHGDRRRKYHIEMDRDLTALGVAAIKAGIVPDELIKSTRVRDIGRAMKGIKL